MLGLGLELAVLDGPLLERPDARDAVVRLPENALPQAGRPRQATGLMPTNAISSFVRTLTGRRATALTNGSPIRRRPSRATRESCSSAKISDFQDGRSADHVRDQPLPVYPCHIEVGRGGVHDLAGLDIDVVALEVQRAPVAVDGDLELVRRVIRDPVVLRLERSLPSPTRTVGSRPARTRSSPGPTVIVALGAYRLIIRSMSLVVVAWWKFFSI